MKIWADTSFKIWNQVKGAWALLHYEYMTLLDLVSMFHAYNILFPFYKRFRRDSMLPSLPSCAWFRRSRRFRIPHPPTEAWSKICYSSFCTLHLKRKLFSHQRDGGTVNSGILIIGRECHSILVTDIQERGCQHQEEEDLYGR